MTKIPTSLYSEATPNPRVMKFTANRMLVDQNIYEFNNRAEASASPLALELFGFPFVESVFISNNFISITKKDNGIEWSDIIMEMREFIRDYLVDGGSVINEDASPKKSKTVTHKEELKREFSDIEKKIADLLDEYVSDENNETKDDKSNSLTETRKIGLHRLSERSSTNSRKVKKKLGYTCQVCGFNFKKVYGKINTYGTYTKKLRHLFRGKKYFLIFILKIVIT